MKLSEEDLLLIEKYFEGTASNEESLLFDEKLTNSESFAEQVALQQTMLTAIKREEDTAFRHKLKNKANHFILPERSRKLSWYYGIAASLLIIVSVVLFLPSDESIFEDNFKPLLEQPIKRGKSISGNQYKTAMRTYSLGHYRKAIDLFNEISDPNLIHEAELYKGNCQLMLGDEEQAILRFKEAKKSDNNWVVDNANWFHALALIKIHDKPKAVKLLVFVAEKEGPYQEKAINLLHKLKWSFY